MLAIAQMTPHNLAGFDGKKLDGTQMDGYDVLEIMRAHATGTQAAPEDFNMDGISATMLAYRWAIMQAGGSVESAATPEKASDFFVRIAARFMAKDEGTILGTLNPLERSGFQFDMTTDKIPNNDFWQHSLGYAMIAHLAAGLDVTQPERAAEMLAIVKEAVRMEKVGDEWVTGIVAGDVASRMRAIDVGAAPEAGTKALRELIVAQFSLLEGYNCFHMKDKDGARAWFEPAAQSVADARAALGSISMFPASVTNFTAGLQTMITTGLKLVR